METLALDTIVGSVRLRDMIDVPATQIDGEIFLGTIWDAHASNENGAQFKNLISIHNKPECQPTNLVCF